MKKISLITAIVIALPAAMQASTMSLSSTATGPSVFTAAAAGTIAGLVPNGSLIRVGTLIGGTTSAFFVEFGTSTVKNAGGGPSARASKVTGSVLNTTEADDAQFNGLPVYIWIYNSATVSATADQAIFRSTFVFPVNDTGGVGDAVTPTATSFTAGIVAIEGFTDGSFNPTGDNATGAVTGGQFVLGTAVPEVSTSMLLFSFIGLVAFRRRR